MENMVQMTLEEYNELLKSKNDYEDRKEEYEKKIIKEGLICIKYVYNLPLGGIRTDYYYEGKDDTIKNIKDELNKIEKDKEDIEKKYYVLKKRIDENGYQLSDRIRILFTTRKGRKDAVLLSRHMNCIPPAL